MKKMNLKKILVLLLVFALVFTAACGKKKEENPNPDDPNKQEENVDSGNQDDPGKQEDQDDPNKQTDPDKQNDPSGDDNQGQDEQKDPDNKGNKDEDNKQGGIDDIIDENNKVEVAFSYNGKNYGFRPNVKTYLIMGVDRYGEVEVSDKYIGTGQCDALYLLVLDHDNDKYTILQLDRDAMVEMNILGVFGDVVGTEVQQLALAHAYGDGAELSCENTVNAISKWLKGVPISGYAALQFDALAILNDDIGGVEVYIEDDWSNIDTTLVQGTTVKLMGEHALNFVHARYDVSDEKNVSRMRRQRTYLNAFQTQFYSKLKGNSKIVDTMYSDVKEYMCTNLSVGSIANMAVKTMDYTFAGIKTIEGKNYVTNNSGAELMEFWANESSLNNTVISLFCKEVKN